MRSCTQRTVTARNAVRQPAPPSRHSPASSERSSRLRRVLTSSPSSERKTSNDTRCGACGSFLFSVVRDGAYVHVAMGSLVDAPTIRPTQHIYVGSKAAWFEITDDLPQFDEL